MSQQSGDLDFDPKMLDRDHFFKDPRGKRNFGSVFTELRMLLYFLFIAFVLVVVVDSIFLGVYSLLGRDFASTMTLLFSWSLLIFILSFLYIALGFTVGTKLYTATMWINAWTNKQISGLHAMRDMRQFMTPGNIVMTLLLSSIINLAVFFTSFRQYI